MDETEIKAYIEKQVHEARLQMVPHNCHTCKWFILREEKPRNRMCRCPDDLEVNGNTCLNWKIQPDVSKVTGRFY